MSADTSPEYRVHPLRSLLSECGLILILCVACVVAVVDSRNSSTIRTGLGESLTDRAVEASQLLALQLGGSVKFGNTQAVASIVDQVLETAGDEAVGVQVVDTRSNIMHVSDGPQMQDMGDASRSLVDAALTSGRVQASDDGLTVASPIFFGSADIPVGAVLFQWTDARMLAKLAEKQRDTRLIGVVTLLIATAIAIFFLRSRMSQPLQNVGRAMTQIAAENYEIDVPHRNRGDEVGRIAEILNDFRGQLATAQEDQVEMAFKGSAFTGTSAALMLVDRDFNVVFSNPACLDLIQSFSSEISDVWTGFDPDSLRGACLRDLPAMQDALAQIPEDGRNGATSQKMSFQTRFGDKIALINMDPALDRENVIIGFVVEWSDETQAHRNAALLNGLDQTQIRLEFNKYGKVIDANDKFLSLIGGNLADTKVCSLSTMFADNLPGDTEGSIFQKQAFAGKISPGRFSAYSVHADKRFILQGMVVVLRNEAGQPERVIVLATDVTEQENAISAAQQDRDQAAEEQSMIVALIGDALNRLADGDLEVDIADEVPETYHQLRADFNGTVEALRRAISAVMHNSDSIRSETSEITSAADDLSRRTEKQAATLEETAAALDQLTVSVRSAAEGADEASKMSEDAQKNAVQGGNVAKQAVSAMDGIKTSSEEISKITTMIDDIAFQTNLLALNAGVEAARAGDAGRGFAVVATEVRALAQRSSEAAREINVLIKSSSDQVREGVDLVDRTGAALAAIVASVSDISTRVSDIAASSREQSSALAEINTAVNDLDHVTQQNAAMFEQTTAAARALTTEADALVKVVSRFKMDGLDRPQAKTTQPQANLNELPVLPKKQAPLPAQHGNLAFDTSYDLEAEGWDEF